MRIKSLSVILLSIMLIVFHSFPFALAANEARTGGAGETSSGYSSSGTRGDSSAVCSGTTQFKELREKLSASLRAYQCEQKGVTGKDCLTALGLGELGFGALAIASGAAIGSKIHAQIRNPDFVLCELPVRGAFLEKNKANKIHEDNISPPHLLAKLAPWSTAWARNTGLNSQAGCINPAQLGLNQVATDLRSSSVAVIEEIKRLEKVQKELAAGESAQPSAAELKELQIAQEELKKAEAKMADKSKVIQDYKADFATALNEIEEEFVKKDREYKLDPETFQKIRAEVEKHVNSLENLTKEFAEKITNSPNIDIQDLQDEFYQKAYGLNGLNKAFHDKMDYLMPPEQYIRVMNHFIPKIVGDGEPTLSRFAYNIMRQYQSSIPMLASLKAATSKTGKLSASIQEKVAKGLGREQITKKLEELKNSSRQIEELRKKVDNLTRSFSVAGSTAQKQEVLNNFAQVTEKEIVPQTNLLTSAKNNIERAWQQVDVSRRSLQMENATAQAAVGLKLSHERELIKDNIMRKPLQYLYNPSKFAKNVGKAFATTALTTAGFAVAEVAHAGEVLDEAANVADPTSLVARTLMGDSLSEKGCNSQNPLANVAQDWLYLIQRITVELNLKLLPIIMRSSSR